VSLEFTVGKGEMIDALKNVGKCISSKLDNNVMKGALFDVNEGVLEVCGTDTQLFGKNKLEVDIIEEDTTVVEYSLLKDLLRNFPDEDITFKHNKDRERIFVSYQDIEYEIPTYDPDMYPQEQMIESNNHSSFDIEQGKLKEVMKRFTKSTNDDDNKPALQGVLVDIDTNEEIVKFVSTDGYRMQYLEYEPDNLVTNININSCVIHVDTMKYLKSLLNSTDEKVEIEIGESLMQMEVGSTVIKSTLIDDDRYPKYEAVIPDEEHVTNNVEVDTTELTSAIRRIKAVSKHNNDISISWKISNDNVKLKSGAEQYSSGKEIVNVEWNDELDSDIIMFFNINYVLDYLKHNKNEIASIGVTEDERQLVFREGNMLYILMPIRSR
jgi:DNA polymerase-3 subunit beta